MKTNKFIGLSKKTFWYKIHRSNIIHGLYQCFNNNGGIGYIYKDITKGFWLEPNKN